MATRRNKIVYSMVRAVCAYCVSVNQGKPCSICPFGEEKQIKSWGKWFSCNMFNLKLPEHLVYQAYEETKNISLKALMASTYKLAGINLQTTLE